METSDLKGKLESLKDHFEEVIKKPTIEERFLKFKMYLKSPTIKSWQLNVVKVSESEFLIFQGVWGNVWARFRKDRTDIWNHEKLKKRMRKDLPKEYFNE